VRLPEAIGQGAQRIGVGIRNDARQDSHLVDDDGRERLEGRTGGLLARGGGLFEQSFLLAQQGFDAFRDGFGRASQRGGGLLEAIQTITHALQRAATRDGLDAANAGGDAALTGDQEQPDHARLGDVRAAAKLVGHAPVAAADGDRAHALAVGLPEQSHGALGDRLLARPLDDLQAVVIEDGVINDRLDLGDLRRRHRLRMGEVEAQPVGGDERARLARVVTQDAVERGVQQVGGGVVAHDVPPSAGVHGRQRRLPLARIALEHAPQVHHQPTDRPADVLDGDLPARLAHRDDRARVGDLAARLDVEGRLGKDHLDDVARTGGADALPLSQQRQKRRLGFEPGVRVLPHTVGAEGARLLQLGQQGLVDLDAGLDQFTERLAGARRLAVFIHGGVEPGLIDLQPLLASDIACDLERQAVGGVQRRRGRTGKC